MEESVNFSFHLLLLLSLLYMYQASILVSCDIPISCHHLYGIAGAHKTFTCVCIIKSQKMKIQFYI